MYYFYKMDSEGRGIHLQRDREAHLFGCNQGIVAELLRQRISSNVTEPYSWHLPIESTLGEHGEAFVIDLKPNRKDIETSRSLYQLRDVWGYSCNEWTPGMLRLRGIVVDGVPRVASSEDLQIEFSPDHDSIYTFVLFDGSIRDGKLVGRWTPPPRSSTNSTLLWPQPLNYFFEQIRQTSPGLLGESTF
jgi:hypothetical protein